jgi:hypothetical protein
LPTAYILKDSGHERRPDARAAASQFEFRGEVLSLTPHGGGHINDTYLVTCEAQGASVRYILQHINRHVFHDPVAVMQNIERVTAHLDAQTAGQPDSARRALHLVPARDGRKLARGCAGRNVARLSLY